MSYPAPEIHGKQEMYELARTTFAALREAGLGELVQLMRTRIFTRPSHEVMDAVHVGEICQWSFKPMVELLLRHAAEIAQQSHVPLPDRRREIVRALDHCGY